MTIGEMEDKLEGQLDDKGLEPVEAVSDKAEAGKSGLSADVKSDVELLDERYRPMTLSNWFVTFMCMNIPIIGLFYLIGLCFSKQQALKRDFARAYLLYQFIFLTIAVVLVGVFCYYGLELADNALKFMQEL